MNRRLLTALLAIALLSIPGLVLAQEKSEADASGAAGFITSIEGAVFFQNLEKAGLRMAVKQGDELSTLKGRVEIDLGDGNWVRLDRDTRVAFTELQKNAATLSVWQGSVCLQIQDQTIQVRSPQETNAFQQGFYRIDVERDKTRVFENPRVVDGFDSWSRNREEQTAFQEYGRIPYGRPDHDGYSQYRDSYGGWAGWTFSPMWPFSVYDWYLGSYPYWSPFWYRSAFFWPSYSWPTWYFGWNPYWSFGGWYDGFYPYGGFGYYGLGAGFYGYGYGYGRSGYYRDGRRTVRRDQLLGPDGSSMARTSGRVYRSISPSVTFRALRPSGYSGPGVTRTYRSNSYYPRLNVRSSSGPAGRSFSGRPFSAPRSSGRSSGGGRRR